MYECPKPVEAKLAFSSDFSVSTALGAQAAITTGAAHTKGAWVQLEAATEYEVYGFHVGVWGASASATITKVLYDIGVGSAGDERVIVPNFMVGTSPQIVSPSCGLNYFPLYIPAGQRVAIRGQSNVANKVCNPMIMFNYGASSIWPIFQYCDALGINTATSTGISITSGNDIYGAYATVATTNKPYKALLTGVATNTATLPGNEFASVAVGITSTDIFRRGFSLTNAEAVSWAHQALPHYRNIPSGTVLQARVRASATSVILSTGLYGFY